MKTINLELLYRNALFDYLKPQFPYLSDDQIREKVKIYSILTELHPVVINTMREACNQCFDLSAQEAKASCYYDGDDDTYNTEVLKESILKLKEQIK